MCEGEDSDTVGVQSGAGSGRRRRARCLRGGSDPALVEEVSRDLGRDVPLPILCGTSVGAINACTMATYADEPVRRAHLMVRYWSKLRIEDILLPRPSDLMGMMRLALGFGHRRGRTGAVPMIKGN
jgi:NTE family protein